MILKGKVAVVTGAAVDLPETGNHLLHLEFLTSGTEVYAFTFG